MIETRKHPNLATEKYSQIRRITKQSSDKSKAINSMQCTTPYPR